MKKCSGCYKEFEGGYCASCCRKLFNGKKVSPILPFETPKDENLKEYQNKTKKLSISGVQLKYSLRLENDELVLAENHGQFILKPIPPTIQIQKNNQAPENEHLTMQIAAQVFGINTAENALIYFKDGTPAYVTRRFDVKSDGSKYQQEDMAQLSGRTKQSHGDDFKYEGTYEEVGKLISQYTAAKLPALERFFETIVFNYIFSNGDAHLKNFSLIQTDMGDYTLSKAYDLISTAIHTPGEYATALTLYDGDIDHEFYNINGMYGQAAFRELAVKLGIPLVRIDRIITKIISSKEKVRNMIVASFLSEEAKTIYLENYIARIGLMGMTHAMLLKAIGQIGKEIPTNKDVELIMSRGRKTTGRFVSKLGDNKYSFIETSKLKAYHQTLNPALTTVIDADQLYDAISLES